MRLLLTGNPGVGKTTLVRAVLQQLRGITCAGFYTAETRQAGRRTGFKIVTLDGHEATLASLGRLKPTVGKYSIHVEAFEALIGPCLDPVTAGADLYVIDEIGKMELFSPLFRTRIIELLDRPANLLATITKHGNGFVAQIKRRSDVELIEVTRANRDALAQALARAIRSRLER
ncbi:MAG TPA: NTPase [Candidatus Eisenbacteria bacterium]|nr:NTPase [Candidatus Eisenbacteria bacterium]